MNYDIDLVGKTVLTHWVIDEKIGTGSYGQVYRAYRRIGDDITYTAIKHMVIPTVQQFNEKYAAFGNDEEKTIEYFTSIYREVLDEIRTMDRLTGKSINIINYRNHDIIKHESPFSYEIFIEMELLTPFNTYSNEKAMTVGEVLKMGIDVASGLEVCHNKGVIHRDIKEPNIFVDSDGNFKIGDFGLAKVLEEGINDLSNVGTNAYKAPEVFKPGSDYNKTVDIYSLGIVLYRLFNNGRIPFLPNYPEQYTQNQEIEALERRIKGDKMPKPACASDEIANVILKACAFRPEDRYQTATEMIQDLEYILNRLTPDDYRRQVDISAFAVPYGDAYKSVRITEVGKDFDDSYEAADIWSSGGRGAQKEKDIVKEQDRIIWETVIKEGTKEAVWEYILSPLEQKFHLDEAWEIIGESYRTIAKEQDAHIAYRQYKQDLDKKPLIASKLKKINRISIFTCLGLLTLMFLFAGLAVDAQMQSSENPAFTFVDWRIFISGFILLVIICIAVATVAYNIKLKTSDPKSVKEEAPIFKTPINKAPVNAAPVNAAPINVAPAKKEPTTKNNAPSAPVMNKFSVNSNQQQKAPSPVVTYEPKKEPVTKEHVLMPGATVLLEPEKEKPKQYIILLRNPGNKIYITHFPFSIGRIGGTCDLTINNPAVSGMHCYIDVFDGRYYIVDNQSKNATYVNGKKIKPHEKVHIVSGDKLMLANEELIFNVE